MSEALAIASAIGVALPAAGAAPRLVGGAAEFRQLLADQMSRLDKLQGQAEQAVTRLTNGPAADVPHVLLAQRRADAAFDALLRVHDTLQRAYEEIKRVNV
jgi:flagellar hook-basal body complex protein FliE